MAEIEPSQARVPLEWFQDNSIKIRFVVRQLAGAPKTEGGVYRYLVAQAAALIKDLQDREEAGARNGAVLCESQGMNSSGE